MKITTKIHYTDQTMPEDVVEGVDPEYQDFEEVPSVAYKCKCDYICYTEKDAEQHALFGHAADRNPEITCHETPVWDHERWCLKHKNHKGKHWTPTIGGGLEW